MTYQITTQKDLRAAFWAAHPEIKRGVKTVGRSGGRKLYVEKTQNEYPTDTRVAWCEFVEATYRNGDISEALAERATL